MNTNDFNKRITAQNMRGVKTGATLQRAMWRLAEMELNPATFEKSIASTSAQIDLFIQDMEKREVKHNTVKLVLDNSEQMAKKVLQYKTCQYDVKHLDSEYARRLSEIQARMSKIEESILPSQKGAFNLAVNSAAEITDNSN
jgi:hypothetical protein